MSWVAITSTPFSVSFRAVLGLGAWLKLPPGTHTCKEQYAVFKIDRGKNLGSSAEAHTRSVHITISPPSAPSPPPTRLLDYRAPPAELKNLRFGPQYGYFEMEYTFSL